MTELPTEMSDVQRAFVQAVETLGATSPAAARPLAELPRISTRELLVLEKSGLIREASDGKVYLFRAPPPDVTTVPALEQPSHSGSWTSSRILKVIVIWFLILLVPVLLIQLVR